MFGISIAIISVFSSSEHSERRDSKGFLVSLFKSIRLYLHENNNRFNFCAKSLFFIYFILIFLYNNNILFNIKII